MFFFVWVIEFTKYQHLNPLANPYKRKDKYLNNCFSLIGISVVYLEFYYNFCELQFTNRNCISTQKFEIQLF